MAEEKPASGPATEIPAYVCPACGKPSTGTTPPAFLEVALAQEKARADRAEEQTAEWKEAYIALGKEASDLQEVVQGQSGIGDAYEYRLREVEGERDRLRAELEHAYALAGERRELADERLAALNALKKAAEWVVRDASYTAPEVVPDKVATWVKKLRAAGVLTVPGRDAAGVGTSVEKG